jgi:ABC-type transport system involved in cytochrome c biogenesis permease subunit
MATTELPRYSPREAAIEPAADDFRVTRSIPAILAPLSSLKLTVALLAISLPLILAGSLAQIDMDIWEVIHDYFRTWIAWIDVQIFLPRAMGIMGDYVFPYPGGKLIGLLLAINLLAAHAVRFHVVASGGRLAGGLALIAFGGLITWAVIASGSNTAIESQLSAEFTGVLWHALRAGLGATALALAYVLALSRKRASSAVGWTWWFAAAAAAVLLGLTVYLFMNPAARLDASGLRILWQLAKATSASIVLGLGCWAVFGKRGGVVLLHGGIGLLMLSELYTAERAVEARMTIAEGQTVSDAEDIRHFELAIIDASDPTRDQVTVVPESLIHEAVESGKSVELPELPFAVRVDRFFPNAVFRLKQPGESGMATAGMGQYRLLQAKKIATGIDSQQAADVPGAYVELLSKKDQGSQGTLLLSPYLRPEVLKIGDATYEIALRFKRIHKPYAVKLIDFKKENYQGTQTAKNYESIVQFRDDRNKIDVTVPIYMNNPLRYEGDTLYQADWDHETERGTVLQVVTNTGWMIPYVACMIIAAGMVVHFGLGIVRFVGRREDEAKRQAIAASSVASDGGGWLRRWRRPQVWVPALVLLGAAAMVGKYASPPREAATEMKIHEFGRLPYGGRTLPIDTLACNTLRTISGRETYEDENFDKRQPAIRWLLDVVSQSPSYLKHKVIRCDNLDVLQALGLQRRKGFRYSIAELYGDVKSGSESELDRQTQLALEIPKEKRNLTQKKFVETSEKTRKVFALRLAFDLPDIGNSVEDIFAMRAKIEAAIQQLNNNAPRAMPPATPTAPWKTVFESTYDLIKQSAATGKPPAEDDATMQFIRLMEDYRKGDAQKFNQGLLDYQDYVTEVAATEQKHEAALNAVGESGDRKPAERLALDRIAFEAYFNHFSPFFLCLILYVAAFVLAALAWLGWSEGFNRSANWLLWFTFALHTFALVCRIYISGRPPVTNLYSSAVFIAWAGVFFALIFETIYKLGLGNLLAATLGFPTMIVAYFLTMENDGDTLGVMQAVLDTNFWLGTHVVCITLGYATTYLAGVMGMMTILLGIVGGALNQDLRRQITRMTYGTVCFAIFFSFIGTILGGLWADDSWGRFWGWDPKENGALMIVIWNAIILHARWGKMIGERGLAALAVFGNVVVTWSYFGVNQMPVGLHAYGATEGRSLWMAIFMGSQLAVIAAAYVEPWLRRRVKAAAGV